MSSVRERFSHQRMQQRNISLIGVLAMNSTQWRLSSCHYTHLMIDLYNLATGLALGVALAFKASCNATGMVVFAVCYCALL